MLPLSFIYALAAGKIRSLVRHVRAFTYLRAYANTRANIIKCDVSRAIRPGEIVDTGANK